MVPSYNKIASAYDFLSRLVFGKSQVRAQVEQLPYLKHAQDILVVGGGTGWILNEIYKINQNASVTYVEYSSAMLALSKKACNNNQVEFVQQDAETFTSVKQYDALLTPFLFDNFDESKAAIVFMNLSDLLAKNGLWLFVDFQLDGKFWKSMLLKSMQLFFRIIGAIKTKQFIETESYFSKNKYLLLAEKFYYGNFIVAKVFRKS